MSVNSQPPPKKMEKVGAGEKYRFWFPEGCLWAFFVIDESDGSLLIMSDYGNWCHYWGSSHGRKSFKHFLCELDRGDSYYLISKLSEGRKEFSYELTMQRLRDFILRNRRDGFFKKDKARRLWRELEELQGNHPTSYDEFSSLAADFAPGLQSHYLHYGESMAAYDYNYHLKRFVREVYPHFANVLRKEISDATVQDRSAGQQ